MSVAHHLKPGYSDRQRVRIITVDTTTRTVQGALKDGSMAHIAVWEVPAAFRWPVENEVWIIRRDNGYWQLDRPVNQDADPNKRALTSLLPGQMRLDSAAIFDNQGRQLMTAPTTPKAPTLSFTAALSTIRLRSGRRLISLSL